AISLSLSGWPSRLVTTSRPRIRGFPPPIPFPLTGRVPRCYTFCVPCLILRLARRVGAHPPVRPPGEHGKSCLIANPVKRKLLTRIFCIIHRVDRGRGTAFGDWVPSPNVSFRLPCLQFRVLYDVRS